MSNSLEIRTSPLAALEKALGEQSTRGKGRLEQDFRQAYPILEKHIAKKMRKKILVEQFNAAYKHELNLIQFRKLLKEERARRQADGDAVLCQTCGQRLVATVAERVVDTNEEGQRDEY